MVNKRGETIAAAVTNLDLHDIARAGRTFGARGFFVVTPLKDQQTLTRQILGHWIEGHGAAYNPARGRALEIVRVVDRLEDALAEAEKREGEPARLVATSARESEDATSRAGS
ncbi:MAG: RNA methyltransferase, partial [Desulfococcaceae bacterium]